MRKLVFIIMLSFFPSLYADVATIGVANIPSYIGSDEFRNVPMLLFMKKWEKFYLELNGANLTTHYRQSETFSYGLTTRVNLGRRKIEEKGVVSTDKTKLGFSLDIGVSARIDIPNFSLSDEDRFTFHPMLQLSTAGESIPLTSRLNLTYYLKLLLFLRLSTELEYRWSNTGYQNHFFGIDPITASQSGLAQFSASSGSQSVFWRETVIFSFAKQWGMMSSLTLTEILGSGRESPYVKDIGKSTQRTLALGLYYYWP